MDKMYFVFGTKRRVFAGAAAGTCDVRSFQRRQQGKIFELEFIDNFSQVPPFQGYSQHLFADPRGHARTQS
jgi:hypothetical protein